MRCTTTGPKSKIRLLSRPRFQSKSRLALNYSLAKALYWAAPWNYAHPGKPMSRPIKLADAARFYNGETHQLAAWNWLEDQVPALLPQFAELYRAAPKQKPVEPPWLAPALRIIREFEGCELTAYKCAAGVWTLGFGATSIDGRPVQPGEVISKVRAEELLRRQVEHEFAPGLFGLIPRLKTMPPNQVAACISWAFNTGLGATETSTLRRRLLAGEDSLKVLSEELPRWNKVGDKPLAGLTRRRQAEVALARGASISTAPSFTPQSPFSYQITPHIRAGEFALDQEARRFDHQYQCDCAVVLAQFLERVRTQFGGRPIKITSGYRPPAINKAVNGASSSEHLYNSPDVGAVDFYVEGADIFKVQDWCDANWPYSLGYGAPKGFVHLGLRIGKPRVRWMY